MTKSLEYWAAGANNFGWLIESAATNGWDFRTKDSNVSDRPQLIVDYNVPAATGNFQVLSTAVSRSRGECGDANRQGGSGSLGRHFQRAASINYTVTAGGAIRPGG